MLTKRLFLACAALAAVVPALAGVGPLRAQDGEVNELAQPERRPIELGLDGIATAPLRVLEDARHPASLGQVRIRERVIIRISPSSPEARQRVLTMQAQRSANPTYREVNHDNCIRVENIVGVQPTSDNRLLLFMENRNVLVAALDRSCSARAFYSDVYIERNNDGRLCVRRDMLQSRAGASCSVEQLTRLVAAGN